MTTIAFKDGIMAYDTLITADDKVFSKKDKAFRINGYVVGCSGFLHDIDKFLEWVRAEMPENKPKVDVDAIIHDGFKVRIVSKGCVLSKPIDDFCAVGTGSEYAIGAMAMGATAKQAVEIAKKYDRATGGRIKTIAI